MLIFNYGQDHRLHAEFGDTKGVIKLRKSKKDRQHNDQIKKDKRTINTTQHAKDRATPTQLKTGGELGCSGRVGSFYSISDIRRVN